MSSASGIDSILSSFSPAQQDAIKALIAQEAAKNQPAPPKELTPAEQASAHVATAREALQNAGNTVTIFDRILSIIEIVLAEVFKAAAESSTANAASTATTVDSSASTSAGSAV